MAYALLMDLTPSVLLSSTTSALRTTYSCTYHISTHGTDDASLGGWMEVRVCI